MLTFFTRLWCIALLFSVWAGTAAAAPTAPSGLNTVSLTATSFTLRWSASTGGTGGIAGYDIYRDETLVGSTTTARTFAVSGLAPTTAYSMTVIARDGSGSISAASSALAVTTPADTTVPTRPADLAVTALTTVSCTLTWTRSTDNVGVSGYNIYRSGVLLGASVTTTFDVTGLTPDTNNNLTVRATDAAGNLSAASVVLAVRTLALPPSIPTGLVPTNLKATSFTLTWSASTGGTGGIAGYDVYQNGALIGSTTTARSLAVTGLVPTTAYHMTVAARDTAGNVSPASATLEVTTPADTTNPTRPTDLASANITTTSFALTWTGSTDNVGVTAYNIYRSGVLLGTTSATTYEVTGLVPDSTNNIAVRAVDAAGNLSSASVALSVRMVALPPSVPTGLIVANLRPASFTLRWTASTGGTGGITGYEVFLNGELIGSPTARALAISGLAPTVTYTMTVISHDSAGHVSAQSEPLTVTTPADTSRPTVPTGLSAAEVTATSFTLTWTASTDNVGVTGYDVYRHSVLIGSTPTPAFAVTGLAPSTLSAMRVKSRDAAGNLSAYSAILPVTTSVPPNNPPTIALTAPVADAIFTLPFTLTLSATATDSDGTITKVQFFDNDTLLGETTTPVSDQPALWLLTLSSQLSAGPHSLTARGTDNQNATTDSAPVVITVNNPNQSPTVALTASPAGIAPAFITVSAEATDSDGVIAKVEFYEESNLLGEVLTPTTEPSTYTFPLTLFSTGTYTITAVATDNVGTQTTSTAVVVTINSGAATLPFVANFEPAEGYANGPLPGQLSWIATGGVTVVPSTTPGSQQELSIPAAQPTEIFSHDFSATGISPVFVDFLAQPVAGADPVSAIVFSTPAAQVALVGTSSPADLWIFGGGGQGWYASGQTVATDANGRTLDWIRLTTREDYLTKQWDLYLNGQMVAADVAFADATTAALTDFSVNGHATAASAFDTFYAGPENPLFADVNHNGIDDIWETAHGLSLAVDNRQLSPTGNGVTVLQSYLNGTDPNDFFNGSAPIITVLAGGSGRPGMDGLLRVRITSPSGLPLANAPVSFSITSGVSQLAASADINAPLVNTISTSAQTDGTASTYYRTPTGLPIEGIVAVHAGPATVSLVFQTPTGGDNQPPTVILVAPMDGATVAGSFGVVLAADAFDVDGTIAKVEFFADNVKLGEAATKPYYFYWTNPISGPHSLTAKATDDAGAETISATVNISITSPTSASIVYDFEAGEGFTSGQLFGQSRWVAREEVVQISNMDAQSGAQSMVILSPESGARPFSAQVVLNAPASGQNVRFFDFWIKPVSNESTYQSSYFSLSVGPIFTFIRDDATAELQAYQHDEYNEQWWYSSRVVPVDVFGITPDWHRITIRQDLNNGGIDVYLDDQPALMGLPFNFESNRFSLFGHLLQSTYVDNFRVLTDNPLFADVDQDGMDDAWESAHGLDPTRNDRHGDRDGDGLTNIQEYASGTDPSKADTDGDGLPDGWELEYGFDPLHTETSAILDADQDGDGLTLDQEAQASTNAQNRDTDGDGVSDGLEVSAGWDPLRYNYDVDGDGISNFDELANGSDPVDYYNGLQPVVTSLVPSDGGLTEGQFIAVKVTRIEGEPLVNAPVTFTASASDHGLAPGLENKRANARRVLRVRTDDFGIARAYVVRADELLNPLP